MKSTYIAVKLNLQITGQTETLHYMVFTMICKYYCFDFVYYRHSTNTEILECSIITVLEVPVL